MFNKYNINYLIGGSTKSTYFKYILLDGTSSSGKSSICNYYSTKGFKCLKGDDLSGNADYYLFYGTEYKKLPNEYITEEFKKNIYSIIEGDYIFNNATQNDKTIIDVVNPEFIISSFKKNDTELYIILVYAGINTLTRNMISRKA